MYPPRAHRSANGDLGAELTNKPLSG
jgi:hypothetical protein